ncbi:MAG: ABC transporter permease [Peptoniphilaceae bacterium]|nr:ABC transporter permease [Peptoniphilaceae bacterium]MDD7382884.1 ABC transporter permease [Peptoniphilaceae bacterium]MDY3738157.1 ABC transporter permease [Peptoniphilaceae bacterium]
MNKHILKFEFKSLLNNYSVLFFGLFFPIILTSLITIGVTKNIPLAYLNDVKLSILYRINIISPISIFLIGLASVFAKDLEEGVYDRLELFSISHLKMAKYKFFVYFLYWFVCNAIYFIVMPNVLDIDIEFISIVKHTCFIVILATTMFLFSYGLSLFTKNYSIAFGTTMVMYFMIIILSGMMGVEVDDLPNFINKIAKILPTAHFSSQDYLSEISASGRLNYSFLQNLLVFLLIALIFFLASIYKSKRKN